MGEISLISILDNSEGCDEESILGYGGLVLWMAIAIYIFMGLYILCEDFFVPCLTIVGAKLNLSQDICGATLLAAGSSSPELFTALIGTFLYPDENPGPSTNCASAVFNMCIIVGLSILSIPKNNTENYLLLIPFIRDCIFYGLSVILLFVFYEFNSEGVFEFYEAFILVLMYVIYVLILAYNDKLTRCFSRGGDSNDTDTNKTGQHGGDAHRMSNVTNITNVTHTYTFSKLKKGIRSKNNVLETPLLSDGYGSDTEKMIDYNNKMNIGNDPNRPRQVTETFQTQSEYYPGNLGINIPSLNTDNNNHGHDAHAQGHLGYPHTPSHYSHRHRNSSLVVLPSRAASHYIVYRYSMMERERVKNTRGAREAEINRAMGLRSPRIDEEEEKDLVEQFEKNPTCKDKLLLYFEYAMVPFKIVFGLSHCGINFDELHELEHGHGHDVELASVDKNKDAKSGKKEEKGKNKDNKHGDNKHGGDGHGHGDGGHEVDHEAAMEEIMNKFGCGKLFTACCVSIFWLGILTFLIVDLSNKIGVCLSLNANIMGLTLLAIGSSLPDAFSSILVAKKGKLSMAVSTALGSNIFDICICVALPFLIKSTFQIVEVSADVAFLLFLNGVFLTLVIYIAMFVPYKLQVKKFHGYALVLMYFVFITVFSFVFSYLR